MLPTVEGSTWAAPLVRIQWTLSLSMINCASMKASNSTNSLISWPSMSSVDALPTTKRPRSKPKWRQSSWTNASPLLKEFTSSNNYPLFSSQLKISTAWMLKVHLEISKVVNAWLRPFLCQIYHNRNLIKINLITISRCLRFIRKLKILRMIHILRLQLTILDTNSVQMSTTTILIVAQTHATISWSNLIISWIIIKSSPTNPKMNHWT